MSNKVPFDLNELSIKASSKRELYLVLLKDCKIYMPPIQDANSDYIRGVLTGKIKYVKSDSVKLVQVPFYDSITTKKIFDFASKKLNIREYLPTYFTPRLPNRVWFCNLVNTLLPNEFQEWIDLKLEDRKSYIINKRKLTVNILPEFKAVFIASKSVSVSRGRSNFLLRPPKEKREKLEERKEVEIMEDESEVKELQYMEEIADLNSKIKEYKILQIESTKYKEIVNDLVKRGVINSKGEELIKF